MNILLQQVVIPDYRLPLFLLLKEKLGDQFQMYAGEEDYKVTPISTPAAWERFNKVESRFFFKRRLLWQKGLVQKLISADLLIASANMRNVTVVTALLARKLLRKKTILWGHASGQSRIGSLLRGFFLRHCNHFIAYTESQAAFLAKKYPWLKVTAAPNACVYTNDCFALPVPPAEVQNILYVGRLVVEKKAMLLLQGFHLAVSKKLLPDAANLIFIGAGPELESLRQQTEDLDLSDRVQFLGHISDVDTLREYYSRAICSVSPGYVGLSATQSFGFGVPMLVADNEFHSPEIEACQQGFTAEFFSSNQAESLAHGLQSFYANKEAWLSKRQEIADWTKSHYTYESMCARFIQVIQQAESCKNRPEYWQSMPSPRP